MSDVFVSLEEFGLENEDLGTWDGEGGIDVPAPREYLLQIDNMEVERSQKGNLMFVETARILADASGSSTTEKGKTVKVWHVLTDNDGSRRRFRSFLNATGVQLSKGGVNPSVFVGRKYSATVSLEPFDKILDDGSTKTYQNPRVTRERPVSRTAQLDKKDMLLHHWKKS